MAESIITELKTSFLRLIYLNDRVIKLDIWGEWGVEVLRPQF